MNYSEDKCRLRSAQAGGGHEQHIAAVCPACYDAALEQQAQQIEAERAQAHRAWLRKQRRAP